MGKKVVSRCAWLVVVSPLTSHPSQIQSNIQLILANDFPTQAPSLSLHTQNTFGMGGQNESTPIS